MRKAAVRARLRDALIFWVYIPAAVLLVGKGIDRAAGRPWSAGTLGIAAGAAIFCAGAAMIQKATWDLARYGQGTPNPQAPPLRLVTEGSYRWCRHPMFLGYDLTALGVSLALASWGMALVSIPLFLLLQVRYLKIREEFILARRFKDEFAAYRGQVPLLLPWPRPQGEKKS